MQSENKTIFGIIGATLIAVIATFMILPKKEDIQAANNSNNNSGFNSITPTTTDTSNANSSNTASGTSTDTNNQQLTSVQPYKDGTYSSSVSYYVEGHSENINVAITIADGIVTNVTNDHSGNDRTSAMYQNSFETSIDGYTVGKAVDDIRLSRIGGASATTNAFNQALRQIQSDAKV